MTTEIGHEGLETCDIVEVHLLLISIETGGDGRLLGG